MSGRFGYCLWALAFSCLTAAGLFAGDILRGGGAGGPAAGAADPATPSSPLRDEANARVTDHLARNAAAMQDVMRMQEAARQAARQASGASAQQRMAPDGRTLPVVPDGLRTGGLMPVANAAPGTAVWQGADLPTSAVTDTGRIHINIKQNAAQALLNWETFNIGAATDVTFEQSVGGVPETTWVAFNLIQDPSANPTQILGSLSADGEVYIINRNGVIFGATSHVNLRSLTASSLPLNLNLIERGILNNPDAQFLLSGSALAAGPNGTPAFAAQEPHPERGYFGSVWVQAGAILESPVSELGVGGRIVLAAPEVIQEGIIRTPSGQALLAAGNQIGVAAHRTDDPTLRGLDVFIGELGNAPHAGTLRQTGWIDAPRGNITLAGAQIFQDGLLTATTSVALNGRIDLQAHFGAFANPESSISSGPSHQPFLLRNSGRIELGAGSVISVVPELDSDEVVAASELALRSIINFGGRDLYFGENSLVFAPSGVVTADAGKWQFRTVPTPQSLFVQADGQIYLDHGSEISVAGLPGVAVPMERNILTLELRGAELANAPLQREGNLRGREIRVDIRQSGTHNGTDWVGTPLADITGFLGLIERSVAELSVASGEVTLRAGDALILQDGASVDVSGGWLAFADGNVQTTRLQYGGRVVDIAKAIPEVAYDGIYTGTTEIWHAAWGIEEVYRNPLAPMGTTRASGYLQGSNGGVLTLQAPALALDGNLRGFTFNGERQRTDWVKSAELNLLVEAVDTRYSPAYPVYTPYAQSIVITEDLPQRTPLAPFALGADGRPVPLSEERIAQLFLDARLFGGQNFGAMVIRNHGGDVVLANGADLQGPAGGSLRIGAANVDIGASVHIPSGSIEITATNVDRDTINRLELTANRSNPLADPDRGLVHVQPGVVLSTAGRQIDERGGNSEAAAAPVALQGGSIALAGFNTVLAEGSVIDVSGGARKTPQGQLIGGAAGAINIRGGNDITLPSVLGGGLTLEGQLLGYALTGGGSLSLSAPTVRIATEPMAPGAIPAGQLTLAPSFFNAGGFYTFAISGIGSAIAGSDRFIAGVEVAADTRLQPQPVNWIPFAGAQAGSGNLLAIGQLPVGLQHPVGISLSATGARDPFAQLLLARGEVLVGNGAEIITTAGGSVELRANAVAVDGGLHAPGGSIRIQGGSTFDTVSPDQTRALTTVWVGPDARMDVSGTFTPVPDERGRLLGELTPGGTIHVGGNLVIAEGAMLLADGASARADVPAARVVGMPASAHGAVDIGAGSTSLTGKPYVRADVASAGGTIALAGEQLLVVQGELQARAGSASVAGGTISIGSGRFYDDAETSTTADINLHLYGGNAERSPAAAAMGLGRGITYTDGSVLTGGGHIATELLNASTIDNLILRGNVQFHGDVALTVPGNLRLATGGVIAADGAVELQAGHLHAGQAFLAPEDPGFLAPLFTQTIPGLGQRPFAFTPTAGSGMLTLQADWLDLGTLSLMNMDSARFDAGAGAIRGSGIVNTAGRLQLEAGVIYPETAAVLEFHVANGIGGTNELTVGGAQQGQWQATPFSAGGTLGLFATTITHEGNLWAPMGTVQIGWDGASARPINRVTESGVVAATQIDLASNSRISVAAMPEGSDVARVLPYGVILNDLAWIDPRGLDVTLGGLPDTAVRLSAQNIFTAPDSLIDARGGGDLLAYRWIPGPGGTTDFLASEEYFAILPNQVAATAPQAPFNPTPLTSNLEGARGYVNNRLGAGDQVYLEGAGELASGYYTLLPARYGLLPGAFLVRTVAGEPVSGVLAADGTQVTRGYFANAFSGQQQGGNHFVRFEVLDQDAIGARAEYALSMANTFIPNIAQARERTPQSLPMDSGRVVYSATRGLDLFGGLSADSIAGGRGGAVDISSPLDIRIAPISRTDTNEAAAPLSDVVGVLTLDPSVINRYNAESLLIGGIRSNTGNGEQVQATSQRISVANADQPLVGTDIILAALQELHIEPGSQIMASGQSSGAVTTPLTMGSATTPGSGDGVLLRVSSGAAASVQRAGISEQGTALLRVDEGAELRGSAVVLDSSARTQLSPEAVLASGQLTLNSGRIDIALGERYDDSLAGGGNAGLLLAGTLLETIFASATDLRLSSYSRLHLYGAGEFGSDNLARLTVSAPVIQGHLQAGDSFAFRAGRIEVGNSADPVAALDSAPAGTLGWIADTVVLGNGAYGFYAFDSVSIEARDALQVDGSGQMRVAGDMVVTTPRVIAIGRADQQLHVEGDLLMRDTGTASPSNDTAVEPAVGASLFISANSLQVDTAVSLPAGRLELESRAGDLQVGTLAATPLSVGGAVGEFHDSSDALDAGQLVLRANGGDVRVGELALLDVAATPVGGNAGQLAIAAPSGTIAMAGQLAGAAPAGSGGSWSLDIGEVPESGFGLLDAMLNAAGFVGQRVLRLRSGDVRIDADVTASDYQAYADSGSIAVTGTIDASGATGGRVTLVAAESLTVADGAKITVAAAEFDSAGKGGQVLLQAGAPVAGVQSATAEMHLQSGAQLDFSVASADAASAQQGQFTGTLTLRTPLNAETGAIALAAIEADLVAPSLVRVEGHSVFDLSAGTGEITLAQRQQMLARGQAWLGASGTDSAAATALRERLLAANPDWAQQLFLLPSMEFVHLSGDLRMGSTSSTHHNDWRLNEFRFGAQSVPGQLLVRAHGDLTLFNAISDGFTPTDSLWLAGLSEVNPLLPANLQSWSVALVAGADTRAANALAIAQPEQLTAGKGNLIIGKNAGAAVVLGGNSAQTQALVPNLFQVVRTGSGDIDVVAGRDIRMMNPFVSIYTAGTRVAQPETLFEAGDFSLPLLRNPGVALSQGGLGSLQQNYPVFYSMAGGNVALSAGGSMGRFTQDTLGNIIPDSSRQMPSNWLYRRGYVDASGQFGEIQMGTAFSRFVDPSASTTWWVDFSNFFQSVATLGGGHVALTAGGNIVNIDASLPTNARMASGVPDVQRMIELGGGDLRVKAGGNIDGGVYYVERGSAVLRAGETITTNATRGQGLGIVGSLNNPTRLPALTWLPTTLVIGKAQFDVQARGDVLLGPVANAFMLPQSVNNRFWYKTYFSTYSDESSIAIRSAAGDVRMQNLVTLPDSPNARNALQVWFTQQSLLATGNAGAAFFQPWLRIVEDSLEPFPTLLSILPPYLRIAAFSGDVALAGNFNLFPSAQGSLDIFSAGAITGLNRTGTSTRIVAGREVDAWTVSRINVSDANPAAIAGVTNPFAYVGQVGFGVASNNATLTGFLQPINRFFAESGANNMVLQTKQALHAQGILHRDYTEPLRLHSMSGDLSGLILYSALPAQIIAARDITDVDLYIQNTRADSVSRVVAGRDIVAFNANSDLRLAARADGNAFSLGQRLPFGDLQISGPGTFEVLAGRDLDLGIGPRNADGTAAGLTSVGNVRNPFLPAQGANIIAAAGIGPATGLANSLLDIDAFVAAFIDPASAPESDRYLPELAKSMGMQDAAAAWQAWQTLPADTQARHALSVFYRVLRNAGRDFNDPEADGFGVYDKGFAAIAALFPESHDWQGRIALTSRQIKTAAGGDIEIIAPGGGLLVGFPIANARPDQGILTEAGGDISIFTHDSVGVGASRIFTLRGGNAIIWSSTGDIAAGSAARTLRAAPPTRVVFDPQTASVQTDISGLATGGGIGVLQTVAGVPPGDVDLIAPAGIIDAGDAGIRVSGSLNIAAVQVVNAANIQAGGSVGGVPTTTVAPPNVGGLTAASGSTAAATTGMDAAARRQAMAASSQEAMPSIVTVEIIGFGGGDPERPDPDDDEPGNA